MTKTIFACLFAVSVAAGACGGSDGDGGGGSGGGGGGGMGGGNGGGKVVGSCNNEMGGFCKEFVGSSFTASSAESMCSGGTNVMFDADPCPTAGVKGTCVVDKGEDNETRLHYYAAFPTTAAQTQCTNLKGEWQGS